MKRINLGSGIYKAEVGWINIDMDPSTNPEIVRDIRRGLPFSDGTCEEVRAYHFLEHLDPEDVKFVFQEVHRVLTPNGPGGLFDVRVPIGVTDDFTHRTFYSPDSFKQMLDPVSQASYTLGLTWWEVRREVIQEKTPTLWFSWRKQV